MKKIILLITLFNFSLCMIGQDYRFSTSYMKERPFYVMKDSTEESNFNSDKSEIDEAIDNILNYLSDKKNQGTKKERENNSKLYLQFLKLKELNDNRGRDIDMKIQSINKLQRQETTFSDEVITEVNDQVENSGSKLFKCLELYKREDLKLQLKNIKEIQSEGLNLVGIDSLEKINQAIEKLQIAIENNEVNLEKRILSHNNFNFLGFHVHKSRAFNSMAYDDTTSNIFNTLTLTSFGYIGNTASLQSELVSANFGILRASVGVTVAANTDSSSSEKEASFNNFANKGGHIFFRGENPLVFIHSQDKKFNLILGSYTLLTAELPPLGSFSKDWAGSASFGFNIYTDLSSDNDIVKVFANFNPRFVFGTKSYRDNLGTSNTNFIFAQATAGIIIKNKIKIGFTFATLSNESVLTDKGVFTTGGILK